MLNLICLYNFTSRRPPVSSHSKPDKHTHSGLAVHAVDTLVQRRSRGPSFSYLAGGIGEEKKWKSLHLHFNLLSISHCVWCCSRNCLVFAPHPYLWCFCQRAPLNSNLPAITACGDEASYFFHPPVSVFAPSLTPGFHFPSSLIFFPSLSVPRF